MGQNGHIFKEKIELLHKYLFLVLLYCNNSFKKETLHNDIYSRH